MPPDKRRKAGHVRFRHLVRDGFGLNISECQAILVFFFPGNEEPNSQVEGFDTGPAIYVCIGRVGVDCNRHYQLGAREIALSYLLACACVLSILDLDRNISSRSCIHSGEEIGKGLTGSGCSSAGLVRFPRNQA
jgi:hypothetical protein